MSLCRVAGAAGSEGKAGWCMMQPRSQRPTSHALSNNDGRPADCNVGPTKSHSRRGSELSAGHLFSFYDLFDLCNFS